MATEFKTEFDQICSALRTFRISTKDIRDPGGNESQIPKRVAAILTDLGWRAGNLTADVIVDGKPDPTRSTTHEIDYVKGRVAFEVEWNSKDQTFDRDLFAFRSFFDFNRISVAVLLTRSNDLDPIFVQLGPVIGPTGKPVLKKNGKPYLVKDKYGASTTHVGKLWWRLDQGRHGGCPVLVFGITRRLISDWEG